MSNGALAGGVSAATHDDTAEIAALSAALRDRFTAISRDLPNAYADTLQKNQLTSVYAGMFSAAYLSDYTTNLEGILASEQLPSLKFAALKEIQASVERHAASDFQEYAMAIAQRCIALYEALPFLASVDFPDAASINAQTLADPEFQAKLYFIYDHCKHFFSFIPGEASVPAYKAFFSHLASDTFDLVKKNIAAIFSYFENADGQSVHAAIMRRHSPLHNDDDQHDLLPSLQANIAVIPELMEEILSGERRSCATQAAPAELISVTAQQMQDSQLAVSLYPLASHHAYQKMDARRSQFGSGTPSSASLNDIVFSDPAVILKQYMDHALGVTGTITAGLGIAALVAIGGMACTAAFGVAAAATILAAPIIIPLAIGASALTALGMGALGLYTWMQKKPAPATVSSAKTPTGTAVSAAQREPSANTAEPPVALTDGTHPLGKCGPGLTDSCVDILRGPYEAALRITTSTSSTAAQTDRNGLTLAIIEAASACKNEADLSSLRKWFDTQVAQAKPGVAAGPLHYIIMKYKLPGDKHIEDHCKVSSFSQSYIHAHFDRCKTELSAPTSPTAATALTFAARGEETAQQIQRPLPRYSPRYGR